MEVLVVVHEGRRPNVLLRPVFSGAIYGHKVKRHWVVLNYSFYFKLLGLGWGWGGEGRLFVFLVELLFQTGDVFLFVSF